MDFLDTPSARFEGIPDYPFAAHFHELTPDGLRMHYLDEGPRDAKVLLMLHGEPSWSYLYRFMIPPCVAAGFRVVVPDLIGFGKSSKPTQIEDYSYERHCAWVRSLLDQLGLERITLFGQDWGSLGAYGFTVERTICVFLRAYANYADMRRAPERTFCAIDAGRALLYSLHSETGFSQASGVTRAVSGQRPVP